MVAGVDLIKMLFPPGIRNFGNICFSTSILQCLLNKMVFKDAFAGLANHHIFLCVDCKIGKSSWQCTILF